MMTAWTTRYRLAAAILGIAAACLPATAARAQVSVSIGVPGFWGYYAPPPPPPYYGYAYYGYPYGYAYYGYPRAYYWHGPWRHGHRWHHHAHWR